MIVISPGLDLVIVRLAKTPEEHHDDLVEWRHRVIRSFAEAVGD
jgi:hypothetical protein